MAYFTSILTAPKVHLEFEPIRRESATFNIGTGTVTAVRNVTTRRYEYRGMTRFDAEDEAELLAAKAGTTAIAVRENENNAWKVSVVEQTFGPWVEQ